MRGQAAARAPPTVRQSSMSMRGAVEPEPVSENDSGEPELWEEVDEQEVRPPPPSTSTAALQH